MSHLLVELAPAAGPIGSQLAAGAAALDAFAALPAVGYVLATAQRP
ncbi:hypothetical protein [Streptomyces sp. NRRL WC-3742]|nr:hypothetical protein [Streptomyces sp. NRRL WC-3742]